ncbi:MAG: ATP-grasp domain-containing protein [Muribaculum sp.]|nr:ATP-grasp domain-containing protein [Muribaculum sp.]
MKRSRIVALLLGAGRRVSMVQLLKRSAERLGMDLSVVSYELSKNAPIAVEGEVVVGLPWDDPDVVNDIMRVAIQHEATLIIPFADGAVPLAAECGKRMPNLYVSMRDVGMAETLYNRQTAGEALSKAGIPAPMAYTVLNAEAPVIAKPVLGSTARNIKIFHDIEDLMQLENLQNYSLQEYIEDFDEYELDCYVSEEGRLLCNVPVKIIEMLGGEPTRALTEHIPELEALGEKIVEAFSLRGPVMVEALFDRRRHRYVVTHVSARLGDAAACAIYAGAPISDYLLKEYLHIDTEPCADWAPNTLMTTYRKEAIFFNVDPE